MADPTPPPGGVCDCKCHENPDILHFVPCCSGVCPHCQKPITGVGMPAHEPACAEFPATVVTVTNRKRRTKIQELFHSFQRLNDENMDRVIQFSRRRMDGQPPR